MPDPKDTSKTQRIKKILWESTLNAPIRGAYNLMNTPYEDLMGSDKEKVRKAAENSFEAAAGATTGSAFVPKPRGAITMGANRNPRPARGVKPNSARQQTLDDLKQGPKMPAQAKDVKPGSARQKTLDSLKQGPKQPEKAADFSKGGARAEALKEARMANRGANRKPRPGEKKFIGPQNKPQPGDRKFIGPQSKPQPGDKRFIGPSNKPQPGDKNFIGPNPRAPKAGEKGFIGPREKPRSGDADFIGPNPRAPKAGEKGFVGPTKPRPTFGNKMKAGAAAGAGLLGFAAYKNADKPKASGSSPAPSQSSGPRDDRASSVFDKAAKFKAKRQGMNVAGSPTNPNKSAPKKAGDKSRAAAKPEKRMSNFERMKQRQYEKEGYGGRSMTSRGAESRVKKERSYKFKDLFKKK